MPPIYAEFRESMLSDLVRNITNYAHANRSNGRGLNVWAIVEFFDEDDQSLGTMELHVALDWLTHSLWFSDEIDLSNACRVSQAE